MYKFSFLGSRGGSNHSKMLSSILLDPNAEHGGIYVPNEIPKLGISFLEKHLNSSYQDLVYSIISSFGIDIGNNDFFPSLKTYGNFDTPKNPSPVKEINNDTFVVELYHGPARAFKDMALQPFSALVSKLAKRKDQNYLVLAATSGDTGPAALAGFKDKPNIKVVCLYPEGGTSHVQKSQMVKMNSKNLKVLGIKGNFDDAQSALKSMMKSNEFKVKLENKGYKLSAANSVNFGRIMFQIVYHFWSYLELVRQGKIKLGESFKSIIPSGNFGNALAAYYAKIMGVPISKIILASSINNILTDFVKTGEYDIRIRTLIKTSSPAMDILKSSNIERLLYHLFGPDRTKYLMELLESKKYFNLSSNELVKIQELFDAGFAKDPEVESYIKYCYLDDNYVIDPHTATAFVVKTNLNINGKIIIASTAEWTKFSSTMAKAFDQKDNLHVLANYFNQELSEHISKLEDMPVIHTDVNEIEQIEEAVFKFV